MLHAIMWGTPVSEIPTWRRIMNAVRDFISSPIDLDFRYVKVGETLYDRDTSPSTAAQQAIQADAASLQKLFARVGYGNKLRAADRARLECFMEAHGMPSLHESRMEEGYKVDPVLATRSRAGFVDVVIYKTNTGGGEEMLRLNRIQVQYAARAIFEKWGHDHPIRDPQHAAYPQSPLTFAKSHLLSLSHDQLLQCIAEGESWCS
jgi:hypothetical protein